MYIVTTKTSIIDKATVLTKIRVFVSICEYEFGEGHPAPLYLFSQGSDEYTGYA